MTYDGKYTQVDLIELGFSQKLIENLLPEPILRRNPHYKKASSMKLYNGEDIDNAMKTEAFFKHMEGSAKRKEASAKAVQTKIINILRKVDKKIAEIKVEKVNNLFDKALDAKQQWYDDIDRYDHDAYGADIDTMNRWAVNYIRHKLTVYDYDLYSFEGKIGYHEAYQKYKNAVLDKIAEIYPEFKAECVMQKLF